MKPRTIQVHARTADFQLIETLKRNRKKRAQEGLFVVEGVRPINLMHAGGWTVDSYVFSGERERSKWADEILAQSTAGRHFVLSDELMDEVSDREETSELLAIVETPERGRGLEAIAIGSPALVVVADRPASPGNLGTLIRSCDALGADGLAVFGHAADIFDPRTIRASTGSSFSLTAVPVDSPHALEEWLSKLRERGIAIQVIGSSASSSTRATSIDWTAPTILMVGNERSGLSRSLLEMCDAVASIPITGSASSLNVASAASILLYEASRQRRGI